MARAADFMIAAQRPTGLFAYEFDLSRAVWTERDNIVRQAGAAYGLAEYFGHSRNGSAGAAVKRALRALSALSRPFEDGALVAPAGRPKRGNAGATALALLAELQYYRASGDGRFERSRLAWAKGLAALHVPGRGFRRSPTAGEESPYYNGEAWLALAYLQSTRPDPALESRLREVDRYMIDSYTHAPHIGFYHWGVMAAAVRHADSGDPRFVEFAAQQSRAYLEELRPAVKPEVNSCYAVEGLVAALALIDGAAPRKAIRSRLAARIEAELSKNLRLQIRPGHRASAVVAAGDIAKLDGAFAAGRARRTLRIDHTQHCLSALVRMARYRDRLEP